MKMKERPKGRDRERERDYHNDRNRDFRDRGGRRNFNNYRRDRGGRRNFKRRRDEQPEMSRDERLRRLLIRIGEKSTSTLAECLEGLATAVKRDITDFEDLILHTLMDCVIHLGVKVPIHATLVGLITIWEPEFGGKVISRLRDKLLESIEKADMFKLRHYVRFLGCLQNSSVVLGSDVAKVLKKLMSQFKNENATNCQKDHVAHIVMSCLTFCGSVMSENYPEELRSLMTLLGAYMDKRGNSSWSDIMQPFKGEETQKIKFLEDYWEGLKECDESGWTVESVLSPHEDFEHLKKCQQLEFIIPDFSDWDGTEGDPCDINKFGVLELVRVDDKQNLIERSIVCEYLSDLLTVFSTDPQFAAEHIINLPLSFDHKFLAMEAIFTHMLQLPEPSCRYVYYAKIIVELFDRQAKVWPKAVGRCLLHLFENMDHLDSELRSRLAQWFAFHLNNFGNNWPWDKWNFVVNLPEDSPRKQFCIEVLREQMQLGNWERVMNSLSNTFQPLMPKQPQGALPYNIRTFETDSAEKSKSTDQIAADLVQHFNRKLSVEDIENYLDTWIDRNVHGKYARVELVFACLLHCGQGSFSHFLSYFKTYNALLKELVTTSETKLILLKTLHKYWNKSQNRTITLIQKLQQYKFIDTMAVIDFVFLPENCASHAESFWMRLLTIALDRIFLTFDGLSGKVKVANARLANLDITDEERSVVESKKEKIEDALSQIEPKLRAATIRLYSGFISHLNKLSEDSDNEYLTNAERGNVVWITRKYCRNIKPHADALNELFSKCGPSILELWTECGVFFSR